MQNVGVQIFFGVGEIAFVGVAYFFPYWRLLALVWFAIPISILTLPIFWVEESPRFTYQKDYAKTVRILNKIARVNRREGLKDSELRQSHTKSDLDAKLYTILDLIR